jgi:CheY-like chemotaxis protein
MTARGEGSAHKTKILVADDERDMREIIALVLRSTDYDTILARDGVEALNLARAEHPDLILLDIVMPRMNGIEVCTQLRANTRTQNIPVVLLTAHGRLGTGIEAGIDDYILKPFTPDELRGIVGQVLRSSRSDPSVKSFAEVNLPDRWRVEEYLNKILFRGDWAVFLVVLDQSHTEQMADILAQILERGDIGSEFEFVGRWSEKEFILTSHAKHFESDCGWLQLLFAKSAIGVGTVIGRETGSYADGEEIVATARKNLRRQK